MSPRVPNAFNAKIYDTPFNWLSAHISFRCCCRFNIFPIAVLRPTNFHHQVGKYEIALTLTEVRNLKRRHWQMQSSTAIMTVAISHCRENREYQTFSASALFLGDDQAHTRSKYRNSYVYIYVVRCNTHPLREVDYKSFFLPKKKFLI